MATPVMMPKVGISVESCILTEWHKKKGEQVKAGDILFTYETDKSTIDEAATVDGTMLDVFFEEGSDVPVMINVCVIGSEGENTSEFAPKLEEETQDEKAVVSAIQENKASTVEELVPPLVDGFIRISPRARLLAAKVNADYRFATPTGPEGRIVESDIRTLMQNGPMATPAASGAFDGQSGTGIGGKFSVSDIQSVSFVPTAVAAFTEEKLSTIRRAIAKSMTTSLTTIPQLTHNSSFDASEIMNFRKKLKANGEALGLGNITLNDIIIYVVSRTLEKPEYKALNANIVNGDTMRYFSDVNIGVAVDTPRGLMVPTIFAANKKSLTEISEEAKNLFAECKKGNISPDKLSGGSFTISNLGSLGIESFTPVINPPQTGILGIDTLMTRVKEVNGEIKPYQAMGLSLTYDHRALDGAPASKFLMDMKLALENFSIMLSI